MKNFWLALSILLTIIVVGVAVLIIKNTTSKSTPKTVLPPVTVFQPDQQLIPKNVPKTTQSFHPPLIVQKTKGKIVCLDPGHSTSTIGASANGVTEITVNFQVAQKLKQKLEEKGIKVVMTKSQIFEEVSNEQRAAIANRAKSNFFLRLHCDGGKGSGITFYYPSQVGEIGGKTGPTTSVIQESAKAAKLIHQATLVKLDGQIFDNGIKTDRQTLIGAQQGALTGSIYSEVPVVLVEMVFLTDKKDAAFISKPAGQEKMVFALAKGIEHYLNTP
ncbi:MAG: hypothetical protein COX39_00045 [Candidatus Nealsonbacteria bacterium CG23_combo_of_CG06-09_8_20_14_all_40_13]|uniref:MurNAc-LAA domain-containing protein n=1 Tax=Candidatus Nealsonbacteria bacterium CG23_combo_of_CG06-09_8_20_14_all_40_13 TaxID=1974724 RepID=A0A2G9YRU8_9BACT|nr:MAG: hypothetical protein COX39_00045 [Candidatus Nealsonbacteria bacterium CG23_combo_of_CG06-09_8_20_14_all_40_13]PIR71248.1 MAG: hypothetical protein COU44_00595 [Candidatus Nealsonbacteria bacterium CG10_big_fil_rev_8_21_14_0_10_40_24]